MENSTYFAPTPDILETRVAIDAEMRRLGWHWKHERIQAWLQRVSERSGRTVAIVADLDKPALESLLANLRDIPTQLQIGSDDG